MRFMFETLARRRLIQLRPSREPPQNAANRLPFPLFLFGLSNSGLNAAGPKHAMMSRTLALKQL